MHYSVMPSTIGQFILDHFLHGKLVKLEGMWSYDSDSKREEFSMNEMHNNKEIMYIYNTSCKENQI